MRRPHYALAGLAGYLLAIVPMAYFVGFLAGVGVPKSVDSGVAEATHTAYRVDLALIAAFGLVHSLLARPALRRRLAAVVPEPLERSVYSAVAGLQIAALMALWRPLPEIVWTVSSTPGRLTAAALFVLGWAVVVWALRAVDDTHLFGLRGALAAARDEAYAPPPLVPRGPYRFVRHPLYSATVVALFAATEMSQGRLLLAAGMTLYIAIGVRFEERDLARRFGGQYAAYRARVPAFLPALSRR